MCEEYCLYDYVIPHFIYFSDLFIGVVSHNNNNNNSQPLFFLCSLFIFSVLFFCLILSYVCNVWKLNTHTHARTHARTQARTHARTHRVLGNLGLFYFQNQHKQMQTASFCWAKTFIFVIHDINLFLWLLRCCYVVTKFIWYSGANHINIATMLRLLQELVSPAIKF